MPISYACWQSIEGSLACCTQCLLGLLKEETQLVLEIHDAAMERCYRIETLVQSSDLFNSDELRRSCVARKVNVTDTHSYSVHSTTNPPVT